MKNECLGMRALAVNGLLSCGSRLCDRRSHVPFFLAPAPLRKLLSGLLQARQRATIALLDARVKALLDAHGAGRERPSGEV